MTEELDDDTLERFAIAVQDLPAIYAQERYEEMVDEELIRRKDEGA